MMSLGSFYHSKLKKLHTLFYIFVCKDDEPSHAFLGIIE